MLKGGFVIAMPLFFALFFGENFYCGISVFRDMRKLISIMIFSAVFYSCSESPTGSGGEVNYSDTLLFEQTGVVDSIVGTCSTFLIRTVIMDTLDFRKYKKLKIEMERFTDGDRSEISIHFVRADTAVKIMSAEGLDGINGTGAIIVNSPLNKEKYYFRMKLFSSICTGQLFHLKVKNLRVYGLK